jgi:glycyl-tRNA synthetase alpha chain
VTERARFIGRVRGMAKGVAEAWLLQREAMGFPLLQTKAAAE